MFKSNSDLNTARKSYSMNRFSEKPSSPKSSSTNPNQAQLEACTPKKANCSTESTLAHSASCPVQDKCGACQLLAIPYEDQLFQKQQEMMALFDKLVTKHTVVSPIAGMENPYYYRNKVTSPYVPGKKIRPGKTGTNSKKHLKKISNSKTSKKASRPDTAQREILCGMYAAGTHNVIATDNCLLENKTAKRIVLAIKQLMQRYHMEPYNEDTGKGFVRHAVIRVGHASNEMLVTLVTNEKAFPGSKNFCRELVKRIPEITTIVQNVNTRQTNVILGEEEKTLYGPGFILDELCGLSFRISSHSFYQVNSTQTEVLYRLAIQMAHLSGTETVLDAYCGTGTIGLVAAKGLPEAPQEHAANVIGVDNIAAAIKDAKNNAQHNGIENAQFITDDAGKFMTRLAAEGEQLDVLLMDPPRAGASEDFLKATCVLKPNRIVYISCNPKTQQRDVAYLTKHGYHLLRIQPVDMFPHTDHTENICLLEL